MNRSLTAISQDVIASEAKQSAILQEIASVVPPCLPAGRLRNDGYDFRAYITALN